ncbi:MAG TPA: zinc ribbon domain-containing protein [Candidatus Baltobacteraceae bacterium]|nr:zinc ribbon domain-containing protein [Candidatus Baltobacteraceae bacterium]
MPTYEYVCEKCGHEFEVSRSITAGPLRTCPENLCAKKKWGRGKVKKKISAGTGLLFKGSGFYITDYRSKNYTEAAKKDFAPAKTETKSEPKPAPAKTSAKPGK